MVVSKFPCFFKLFLGFCFAALYPSSFIVYAQQNSWPNCAHYFISFPRYENHKEPTDLVQNGCKWGTWVTFSNKIIAIEWKVGAWQNPEELFSSKDFLAIYKHPSYYQRAVIAYIAESFPTDKQKKIAIYAMRYTNDFYFFLKECFDLYKHKKLSKSLFETVLQLKFLHPIYNYIVSKANRDAHFRSLLQQISKEEALDASLRNTITQMLSGDLIKASQKHPKHTIFEAHRGPFDLKVIFQQMEKECQSYDIETPYDVSYIPYFLMILDHPCYYLYIGNATLLESHACPSSVEKYWAIFAMRQIGLSSTEQDMNNNTVQVYNLYSDLIRSACSAYRCCPKPTIPLYLMEDLLHARCPGYIFKYPFFILDYKSKELQDALDEFRSIPVLPCGLKEMAKKIQAGKLATPKEMAYMEGYRKFRATHFTLYETVLPCVSPQ
ncbi:hypothetical protein [Candidatus Cardinium hertigii]|nr:hypothetical protein [Candidatus Cardinium hertigii]